MQNRWSLRSFAWAGFAVTLCALLPAPTQAQEPRSQASDLPRLERWEFGILPTLRKLSGHVMGDHVWGMGATLSAEYLLRGPWAIQSAVTGAFTPQLNFRDQATLNEVSASVAAVLRSHQAGPWAPYALLGVALERFRIVDPPAGIQPTSTFLAPHLGAGVRYQLNHRLAWRAELNTQVRSGGASIGAHSGLSFRFVSPPPPPAPPAPRTIVVRDTVVMRDTVVQREQFTVTDTLRMIDTVVVRELHNVERVVPGETLILTLKDANFDFARWTLRPEASPPLDSLATQLIAAQGTVRIKVVGHTDHVGSHANNRTLGMARAISVREHLTARGVPANLIEVRTEGEESPIATNATEAGRQLNRRVVIWRVP